MSGNTPAELIGKLRSWPAMTQGDALSAGVVATLMEEAADQLTVLTAALNEARNELVRLRDRYGTAHSEVVIARIDAALTGEQG